MSMFYTVQYGDTLPFIANYFGTTPLSLAQLNSIPYPYSFYEGDTLVITDTVSQTIYNNDADFSQTGEYDNFQESTNAEQNCLDTEMIENIIGKKGTFQAGVLKFTFPRYDLDVNLEAITLEPVFALTSWMAFQQVDNYCIVMGDMVLLESEVSPAMSQAIDNGFEITALHNHLLYEIPRIMFMHISGYGDAQHLAQGIKKILSETGTPINTKSPSSTFSPDIWSSVETFMGTKGKQIGNVIQFSFPRADIIKVFNMTIPPSMGISQAINFQLDGEYAAVTGDFVLISEEVEPVVRTLKQYGIIITAIHNHMLYEEPRLFYLHFWAVDNPEMLAYALKQTLEQTNYLAV